MRVEFPHLSNLDPFITGLERVIYTMLVVPCFVLSFALSKLILHYLMYHLESFNELLGFVQVTINNNILPKIKYKR